MAITFRIVKIIHFSVLRTEIISISDRYFCRWYRNALSPVAPGSNYSVIIRSNSRGFALESVCASRRQTGRHFEGQLNLVERPTTAGLSRTRIRAVDALSCASYQLYR